MFKRKPKELQDTSPMKGEATKDPTVARILERLLVLEDQVKVLNARLNELEGGDDKNGNSPNETSAGEPRTITDVFVSLHVASSLVVARLLKQFIETKYGCKVFLCTDMVGGASYRSQIVDALESCKVFIPLINQSWATSGECMDEFNHARRLNLISHKTGRTKSPDPREPVILPVYFSDFDFLQYRDCRLLASSINFLPLDVADPVATWNKVVASVEYLRPPGMPLLISDGSAVELAWVCCVDLPPH